MSAVIAKPSTTHESAFVAMVMDFETHDPENAGFYAAAKQDLEGRVPCTHRWLVEDRGAVVGVTRLRHHINTPFLASEGGHVGYDVAPSWRGKGYGNLALRAALQEAGRLDIDRVLLIADENNVASRKVIERHGGALEAIVFSEHWSQRVCRYWIRVPRDDTHE